VENLLILTADSNGGYPVPAVKGGAVSTLVEHLIEDNEVCEKYRLTVLSFYDEKAQKHAEAYKKTKFSWVKVDNITKCADGLLYLLVKLIFPRKKATSFKSIFSLLRYIHFARKFVKNNNFEKIIIENNIPLSLVLKNNKFKTQCPKLYYHLHNVPRINAGCKEVLDGADGFLCVSKFVANEIQKNTNKIGPVSTDKIHVLQNCIDLKTFNTDTDVKRIQKIKNKFNIQSNEKIILFAGRLSWEKGIDKVIEALTIIEKNGINAKLLIVGSQLHGTNNKDEYQKKLKEISAKISDKIVFTGYVEQSIMKYYYQMATVSILPSMWEEPAGLTMLESMACGTPVITTKSGGIPEYVGDSAIVLDKNKDLTKKIAEYTQELIQNKSLYTKYKNSGLNLVKTNFSSVGYMSKLQRLIKNG